MIISRTPLRISFFGGGTDLESFWANEEGLTISTTIDKYLYVIVKQRTDHKICLKYSEVELVDSVNSVKHEIIKEVLKFLNIHGGIDICILTDVPDSGTGLGTSSSLTVGLLKALYEYKGQKVSEETLAQEACTIEINKLKKPIGKQDQYIAAYGGIKRIKYIPNGTVKVDSITINQDIKDKLESHIMLFYTGIKRRSESILDEQNAKTKKSLLVLRKMKGQVNQAVAYLEQGNINGIGSLLLDGWKFKKTLGSKISNETIDNLVAAALNAGALGTKITGAGGGGFILVICDPKKQFAVRESLSHLEELKISLAESGSCIILNLKSLEEKEKVMNVFA